MIICIGKKKNKKKIKNKKKEKGINGGKPEE